VDGRKDNAVRIFCGTNGGNPKAPGHGGIPVSPLQGCQLKGYVTQIDIINSNAASLRMVISDHNDVRF
jgi:hypothetical protein